MPVMADLLFIAFRPINASRMDFASQHRDCLFFWAIACTLWLLCCSLCRVQRLTLCWQPKAHEFDFGLASNFRHLKSQHKGVRVTVDTPATKQKHTQHEIKTVRHHDQDINSIHFVKQKTVHVHTYQQSHVVAPHTWSQTSH